MQDFTGVPAVVDLAAMRDAMRDLGGDPAKINPQLPTELVIDHSIQVDEFATGSRSSATASSSSSATASATRSCAGARQAFDDFKVVPPNTGIVPPGQPRVPRPRGRVARATAQAFPDTLVGTDSHTTMVNGLGVLGWGVGGIEAEAVMLGEAISMLVPQVVGFRLEGELPEGATATDLVLTVTQILRQAGVVGKFVEYFGPGLAALPLADRATIGNMSPEYGATCGFFPVDEQTLDYLRLTGRPAGADRARRGLLQGERALARRRRPPDVLAGGRARPRDRRAEPRRARAARRTASRSRARRRRFLEALATFGVDYANGSTTRRVAETFPASDPTTEQAPGGEPEPVPDATPAARGGRRARRARARRDRRRGGRARPRRGRDRRDHELHEHLEPAGDGRRRAAREEGGRARPDAQAVGQVEPRARLEGRHRVLRARRA